MRPRLKSITLRGFKSLADLSEFEPGPITVLIGPNGAGKSNFISFFRLLSWMLAGKLQEYVARQGGAGAILTDGPEHSHEIEANLHIEADDRDNEYSFRLEYAADDTLVYTDERLSSREQTGRPPWHAASVGYREAQIVREMENGDETARAICGLLRRVVAYQFNNTSETARIRRKWNVEDARYLKEDGANLAGVLYRLKTHEAPCYRRIVGILQRILPFFSDFELEPEYGSLLLKWREHYCDRVFSAAQAADGMLRVMALTTLLCMPQEDLPDVLILDEPELGLHPAAIGILGGLIRSLSMQIQVIAATQSLSLVDCFAPEDIAVVERGYDWVEGPRRGRYTSLHRLNTPSLAEWLYDYSLSELFEKNVIGGRP